MAQYKSKFVDIDPETCSMEELHKEILKLQNLSGFYETKQLALKKFINSVYGATASKYFVGHNTDVAESITAQGQDLNHFSENSVNYYYQHVFNTAEEYNRIIRVPILEYVEKYKLNGAEKLVKKNDAETWVDVSITVPIDTINNKSISGAGKASLKGVCVETKFGPYLGVTFEQVKNIDINNGRVTEQIRLRDWDGKFNEYLDGEVSLTVAGDTDSVSAESIIHLDGAPITISDAFTSLKYENKDCVLVTENNTELVPVQGHTTKAFDEYAPLLAVDRPIKYIMRHKVKKAKYKITSTDGKEVIVTEDHSCMVVRDGVLVEAKPCEINSDTDRLVTIH